MHFDWQLTPRMATLSFCPTHFRIVHFCTFGGRKNVIKNFDQCTSWEHMEWHHTNVKLPSGSIGELMHVDPAQFHPIVVVPIRLTGVRARKIRIDPRL